MVSPGRKAIPAGAVVCLPQRRRPVDGDCEFGKRTYKPNSVVCGHSSRRRVAADAHQRPTRRFRRPADGSPLQGWVSADRSEPPGRVGPMRSGAWLLARASLPIWSCSVWGLPCLRRYRRSGALLPHHFTLTGVAARHSPLGPVCACRSTSIRRYVFCGTGRPWVLRPTSRKLSGTLPCGVRTFLSRLAPLARTLRQRPPGPPANP